MANYNTWLVTAKRFRVKDPDGFIEDLEEAQVTEAKSDYSGLHYQQESDGRFWLSGYNADLVVYLGGSADSVTEVDVAEIVREHIRKNQTAIFKVVGQEKLRAVSGAVVVVTWYGVESRTLDEIAFRLEDEMNPLKQGVKNVSEASHDDKPKKDGKAEDSSEGERLEKTFEAKEIQKEKAENYLDESLEKV